MVYIAHNIDPTPLSANGHMITCVIGRLNCIIYFNTSVWLRNIYNVLLFKYIKHKIFIINIAIFPFNFTFSQAVTLAAVRLSCARARGSRAVSMWSSARRRTKCSCCRCSIKPKHISDFVVTFSFRAFVLKSFLEISTFWVNSFWMCYL